MSPNPQKTADLVKFTEEILNRKLLSLSSIGEIWGYFQRLVTPEKGQNLINDRILTLSCSCQKDPLYKVWTIVKILNHFYSLLP